MNVIAGIDKTSNDVIAALGFTDEMKILRQRIAAWVESCDSEMREALEWQFLTGSKYFRPLTIFACYRSLSPGADTGSHHVLGRRGRVLPQRLIGD